MNLIHEFDSFQENFELTYEFEILLNILIDGIVDSFEINFELTNEYEILLYLLVNGIELVIPSLYGKSSLLVPVLPIGEVGLVQGSPRQHQGPQTFAGKFLQHNGFWLQIEIKVTNVLKYHLFV